MDLNPVYCSSNAILEEIKCRIKILYGSQERFAKEIGYSRKALNRILNHNCDWLMVIKMCKALKINGIQID